MLKTKLHDYEVILNTLQMNFYKISKYKIVSKLNIRVMPYNMKYIRVTNIILKY